MGFIMYEMYSMPLYTVTLSAVDDRILLLPVNLPLENTRTWSPTLFFSSLRRITCKALTLVNVKRLSRLQRQIYLANLQKLTLLIRSKRPNYLKTTYYHKNATITFR